MHWLGAGLHYLLRQVMQGVAGAHVLYSRHTERRALDRPACDGTHSGSNHGRDAVVEDVQPACWLRQ